jgi:nitrogen fixation protein
MANDIIDINVYETTETVSITVNPNLTTININEVSGVGGSQNLQSVTNFGNTTTTSITANSFIKSGGTGANVLLDNGTTTVLANLGTKNDINSKQLQLNYLDRDNSIFDAFYLRTIADGGTVEASNELLSSLAVLRNISYVNQGYTQQINADKFVKLGGTSAQYLMADGSVTTGGGGGGGATNLAYTPSPTNGIVTSDTGTDATIPLADVTNAGLLTSSEKTKIANSVPYTGATTNVNLGEFGLTSGQVTLDTTPTGTAVVGTTQWNDSLGSSQTTLKGGNVVLKNGVDLVARVVNKVTPNQTLTKAAYQAVRVSGATGQRLSVELAQGDVDLNSADTIGLVTETIATNQEGFIITMGQIENINTTGSLQSETWLDGDVLYLSPTVAGRLTNIKPNGSNGHIVVIGYVEYAHAINGKIYVKIMNGWELDELHNVYINNPLNNEGLFYETSTQLWKNKSISTVLGYTPANDASVVHLAGTETISGLKTFTDNLTAVRYLYSGGSIFPEFGQTFYINGIGATHYFGGGTSNAQNNLEVSNGTLKIGLQTASTIASFDANKNVVSLPLATYPSLSEISYVKGVTSGIQTQFSGKQDTLQSTVNIKSINGNSILGSGDLTISASAASQGAFTVLANNTNASAVPTEQVFKNVGEQTYTPTPSWAGTTAPSGTTDHTYMWSQVGNLVTLRINLSYSVAGSALTSVVLALPSDLPTPETPSSVTVVNDVVNYGSGMLTGTKVVPATPTAEVCALRLKTLGTPNAFEIYIGRASASHRYAYAFIQYFV